MVFTPQVGNDGAHFFFLTDDWRFKRVLDEIVTSGTPKPFFRSKVPDLVIKCGKKYLQQEQGFNKEMVLQKYIYLIIKYVHRQMPVSPGYY